jgi:tellurite resistance protein
MEFLEPVELNQGQAEAMARGLISLARADGKVHEREMALVQSFYGDVAGQGPTSLSALEKAADIDPATLATALSSDGPRKLFLKTAILLGFADGDYSKPERALVDRFAKALGVPAEELVRLEQGVKEYLLGHVSGLKNVEAATAVAKKLGM